MKKLTIAFLVVVSLFAISAFAKGTTSKGATKHGSQVAGEITSVNESAKSLVLHSGKKDLTIYWTDATKVTGGSVKANEHATIRVMEKDGKWWATSVKITGNAEAAKPAAAKKAS